METSGSPDARTGSRERESSVDSPAAGQHGGKFLTFYLAGEEYGLQILKVQEIIGMMDITPVPGTPPFISGVTNLRGKVIPILDLRAKFEMPHSQRTPETCVIVVNANHVQTGIVVDQVSEVLDIPSEQIQDPPAFGAETRTDYLLGIGKSEGRVKLLLDIDRVLAKDTAALGPLGAAEAALDDPERKAA